MAGLLSIARDKAGNSIPSATITVFETGTSAVAAIFSDPQLTVAKPNPFTSDINGNFHFFASAGVYDIQIQKQGFETALLTQVQLPLTQVEADEQYLRLDTSNDPLVNDLNMDNNRIEEVADPVNPQDAANKQYVDGQISTVGDATYLRLDTANDPLTGSLDLGRVNDIVNVRTLGSFIDVGDGDDLGIAAGRSLGLVFGLGVTPGERLVISENLTELLELGLAGGTVFRGEWPEIEAALGSQPAVDRSVAIKEYVDARNGILTANVDPQDYAGGPDLSMLTVFGANLLSSAQTINIFFTQTGANTPNITVDLLSVPNGCTVIFHGQEVDGGGAGTVTYGITPHTLVDITGTPVAGPFTMTADGDRMAILVMSGTPNPAPVASAEALLQHQNF